MTNSAIEHNQETRVYPRIHVRERGTIKMEDPMLHAGGGGFPTRKLTMSKPANAIIMGNRLLTRMSRHLGYTLSSVDVEDEHRLIRNTGRSIEPRGVKGHFDDGAIITCWDFDDSMLLSGGHPIHPEGGMPDEQYCNTRL